MCAEHSAWPGFTEPEIALLKAAKESMRQFHGHIDGVGLVDDLKNGRPLNAACWLCSMPRFRSADSPSTVTPQHDPSPFGQARTRMTSAYSVLFELEQTMRSFIENQLVASFGENWWSHVHQGVRSQIESREREPQNLWFDDFSTSRFKFADFDGLRLTVMQEWKVFAPTLGDKDAFQSNMVWLSHARNRVAHANTLSEKDNQQFHECTSRILALVKNRVQLE